MTDLFDHAAERHRERSEASELRSRILRLERENMELKLRLANALSSMKPLWHAQARGARKMIREAIKFG